MSGLCLHCLVKTSTKTKINKIKKDTRMKHFLNKLVITKYRTHT